MKILLPIVLSMAFLSACTTHASPPQTLEEKLAGKTPQERQEVLRLACLNEADWSTYQKRAHYERLYGAKRSHLVSSTEETDTLKILCREMTTAYLEGKE